MSEAEQKTVPGLLVVDDEPATFHMLKKILREQGCDCLVRFATTGHQALAMVSVEPPDLILLDVGLREMDGYQVCARLKEDDNTRDIPVLFVSGMSGVLDKAKAFRLGAVDYVTKPFRIEELTARIRTHLRLREYGAKLQSRNQELSNALDKLGIAQKKLVQFEKMASLGVLTAGIAHEINNPVNFICSGIKGLTGLLDDLGRVVERYDQLTPENAAGQLAEIAALKREVDYDGLFGGLVELVGNIDTGAKRAAEIVRGLRVFSRQGEVAKTVVDLHEELDAALLLLNHRYRNEIAITRDYGEIPMLLASPGKLSQVFMNILANAIEAIKSKSTSDPGESIVIHTRKAARDDLEFVVVSIADSGPGMDPESASRLFEPFFTTKEAGVGMGLGLAISLDIVREHDGFLEFVNQIGRGVTFEVWLPLAGTAEE